MSRAFASDVESALKRAASGRRVLVKYDGTPLAIVPAADLEAVEAIEAEEDADRLAVAEAAKKEAAARGERPVPWDEARRR